MSPLDLLAQRAATLLDRLDQYFPPLPPREPDWNAAVAFRWRIRNGHGYLEPVRHVHHIALSDLHNVDMQKQAIERNTRQFIAGKPANNVLLTGARGTGKSSLVKAVLNRFAPQGLRLIEVEKEHLVDLPDIVERVAHRPERFVVFCDDLSFDEGDVAYIFAEVAACGSPDAATAVAEVDAVQVVGEDLVLRVLTLDAHGEEDLRHLACVVFSLEAKGIARELLGDGAAALLDAA